MTVSKAYSMIVTSCIEPLAKGPLMEYAVEMDELIEL
jgi:Fe-S cluster assembly scaffold protein SufB